MANIIERLREASKTKTIVLRDYTTNCDVDDPKSPLSHAFLVKAYAEGYIHTTKRQGRRKMQQHRRRQKLKT